MSLEVCRTDRGASLRTEIERRLEGNRWPHRFGASGGVSCDGAVPATADPATTGALAALTARAEHIRTAELHRYRSRLCGLDDSQRSSVEELTASILAELLRRPAAVLPNTRHRLGANSWPRPWAISSDVPPEIRLRPANRTTSDP